jgi:hypothetical protein
MRPHPTRHAMKDSFIALIVAKDSFIASGPELIGETR